jgi:hypothetical protein
LKKYPREYLKKYPRKYLKKYLKRQGIKMEKECP